MKNQLLPCAAALALSGLAALAIAGCGQGSGATTGTGGTANPAMVVTVGDAPLTNILSAKVTISSISLTPSGGGSAVTVLSNPRTIELSSLGAIQEPLETQDVPAGTYSAVNVAISSATVTYLDSTGAAVNGTATVTSASDTVALNPALTVSQGHDVHLSLNFNLAQSFDLTGSTLTFTPAITSAAASIESENAAAREVEVTGSVVTISSTSITVQSAGTGAQSTFAINSSTQFSANTSASSIQQGSIVTIHGLVQTNGSMVATMISSSMDGKSMDSSQGGGRGIVTSVSTSGSGSVTSFTFVPREDFGDMSSTAAMTVSLSSSTVYGVDQEAIQDGILATAFTNAEIFPGQSVQVIGMAAAGQSIAAQEVDLAPESLSGTLAAAPQGTAPAYTFTLQLPKESYLTIYQSLTTLMASTSAQTQYEDSLTASGFASLAAGTTLEMHGYLLRDTSDNYSLAVADISQVQADN